MAFTLNRIDVEWRFALPSGSVDHAFGEGRPDSRPICLDSRSREETPRIHLRLLQATGRQEQGQKTF